MLNPGGVGQETYRFCPVADVRGPHQLSIFSPTAIIGKEWSKSAADLTPRYRENHVTIRVARLTDAAAIHAIYLPIVEQTSISFELVPPSIGEIRERISRTLEMLPWLVSEDSRGGVNGYVYASKHRERPAYQWSVDVTVYIREDSRSQGIGGRLYRALFEELVPLGYFQAFGGIALPNRPSIALHESVGFRHIGTYRSVGFKLGAWHDVEWWQKELQPPTDPRLIRSFADTLDGG